MYDVSGLYPISNVTVNMKFESMKVYVHNIPKKRIL